MSLRSETSELGRSFFMLGRPYGNVRTASQTALNFYDPQRKFRQMSDQYYATVSTQKSCNVAEESVLSQLQTTQRTRTKRRESVSRLSGLLNLTESQQPFLQKRAQSLQYSQSQLAENAFNRNFVLKKSWVQSLNQSKQQFGLEQKVELFKKSKKKFQKNLPTEQAQVKSELKTKSESFVPELIRKLIFVPISALDRAQQIQSQEKLFIRGVQLQETGNFKQAIRFYNLAIYSKDSTGRQNFGKTNTDGQGYDSDNSVQDLEGYDSEIQSKQLPRLFFQDMTTFHKNQAMSKNIEDQQLEINNFCWNNLSICLLKSGYLKKGLESLDKVTGIKVVQIYNASVMRLAQGDVKQATRNLSFVIYLIANHPVPGWVDPVLLKGNILSLLMTIRKMCDVPSKLKSVQEIVFKGDSLCVDLEFLFVPGLEVLKQEVQEIGTKVITVEQQKLEDNQKASNIFNVVQVLEKKLKKTNIMRVQSESNVDNVQMMRVLEEIKYKQHMKFLKLSQMKRQSDFVLKSQKKEKPALISEPISKREETVELSTNSRLDNKPKEVQNFIQVSANDLKNDTEKGSSREFIKEVERYSDSSSAQTLEEGDLKSRIRVSLDQLYRRTSKIDSKKIRAMSPTTFSKINLLRRTSSATESQKSNTSSDREKRDEERNDVKVDGLIYAKNLLQDDKTDSKESMTLSLFINSINYTNLNDKIENLAKYVQKKQIEQIRSLVDRMLQIRKSLAYDKAFAKFKKSIAAIKSIHLQDAKDLIADFLLVLEEKRSKPFEVSFIRDQELLQIIKAKTSLDNKEHFNFQHIFDLLKRFPILEKVTSAACQKILEKSDIQIYEPGQKLFKQKDRTPDFFILVKGVVSISSRQGQYPGVTQIVKTFFDGAAIGEMAYFDTQVELLDQNLIKSLSQQRFTAVAVEKSWVLKVSKKVWSQQTSSNQNDLSKLLVFLQQCALFEGISTPNLVPLAQNLEFLKFKLGMPIIDKGVEPKGIFFIFKGHCRVGIKQKLLQKKLESKFCWYRQKYPPIKTKNTTDPGRDGKVAQIQISSEEKILNAERNRKLNSVGSRKLKSARKSQSSEKIFLDRLANFDDDGNQVQKGTVIECKFRNIFSLTERDYFGGRQLLKDQEINSQDSCNSDGYESNMFVVADSAEVSLLYMDQGLLRLFPSEIQVGILNRLKRSKFITNQLQSQTYLESKITDFNWWDNEKKRIIENVVEDNYTNRNGIQPR